MCLFALNWLGKIQNAQFWLFSIYTCLFAPKWFKKLECPILAKKTRRNLEQSKLGILNFSNNFPQKDWKKSGTTKIGQSNFFRSILVKEDRYKFVVAKIGHSKFFPTSLMQKDRYKFGMAKIGHSKFFPTSLVQKDCKKFVMAKIGILNFFEPL